MSSATGGLPPWASAALFTAGLGGLCFAASDDVLEQVNGGLVVAVLASFLVLLALLGGETQLDALLHANLAAVPASLPVLALSFVYQNVVPVVATNLEGDLPRVRTAVLLGTALPLVMFLAWDAAILGTPSPLQSPDNVVTEFIDPLLQLRSKSGVVAVTVEAFSFFAIATSYIGFVLGLSDYLRDLLKLPSGRGPQRQQVLPFALTVVPPAALAVISPDVFYKALDLAGTYGGRQRQMLQSS
eukprot:TRINITY_DN8972_c0_g1_i1.p1 TRINITY_DN8972_c0_g1~~TRINITY_DN8972_c0_g1_i1.p1  ORF type:complete len:250 (+),score=43.42 TRINITY_DN8972_c0_g1_i1:22-750(+)